MKIQKTSLPVRYWLGLFVMSLLFNNCSQFKAGSSVQSLELASEGDLTLQTNGGLATDSSSPDAVEGSETQFVVGPSLDDRTCFRDYLTIFSWTNPEQRPLENAPILGANKLSTVKLFQEGPAPVPSRPDGWFISGYVIQRPDGGTQQALKINKAVSTSTDSLDCYLMRLGNQSTVTSDLANTEFRNIGIDQTLNTLIGFLRHRDQYIACKVTQGSGSVIVASQGGPNYEIAATQAFVIKRGCYQ
jgi:hypothetical protein